jgi:hypothetical protein
MVSLYSYLLSFWGQCVDFIPTATSCYSGASVMVSPYSYLLLFWGQCVDFTLKHSLATAYWVRGAAVTLQLHLGSCVLVHPPTPSAMPGTSFVF